MVGLVGSFAPGHYSQADFASRRFASGEPDVVPADQRVANGSFSSSKAIDAAITKPVQRNSESARTGEKTDEDGPPSAGGEELTESEERQVRDLKQRDQEVRAHEQAHATVGGSYASAPSYEYTVGPDGKRYATSGEVKIDASPVRDNPKATIRKMEIVIRAALAPAEPSSQDLQVAKQAQETRAQAQAELAKQQTDEAKGNSVTAQDEEVIEAADRFSAELAHDTYGRVASTILEQSSEDARGLGGSVRSIRLRQSAI